MPSAAQLADGISTDDWSIPAERGWRRIDPDFSDFWDVLHDIIESGKLETENHVTRLETWVSTQRAKHPPVTVGKDAVRELGRR